MSSIVLSGKVLKHFKKHSQYVSSLMEDDNKNRTLLTRLITEESIDQDTFTLHSKDMPNGEIDIEFLKDWVRGKKIGEVDKTRKLTISAPYSEDQIISLLDMLMYDKFSIYNKRTVSRVALIRLPFIGKPGTIVLGHGTRKPRLSPVKTYYENVIGNNGFSNNMSNLSNKTYDTRKTKNSTRRYIKVNSIRKKIPKSRGRSLRIRHHG